ncbi:MAG TPA: hypothetical protein VE987_21110 [Polyangiaceae bacterium]|nr:hypothetical protein [Polyangiaceae bacterium]
MGRFVLPAVVIAAAASAAAVEGCGGRSSQRTTATFVEHGLPGEDVSTSSDAADSDAADVAPAEGVVSTPSDASPTDGGVAAQDSSDDGADACAPVGGDCSTLPCCPADSTRYCVSQGPTRPPICVFELSK